MTHENRCDGCNRMFDDGDNVTVLIPNVKVTNRYNKSDASVRLKMSPDAVELRAAKLYCKKCLNYSGYILEEQEDEEKKST